MSRYEHWLARGGRASWPTKVVGLECTGIMDDVDAYGTRQVERLDSWYAATMRGQCGSYDKAKSWEGTTCESFWTSLSAWTSPPGYIHVYSWRALRTAALLGVWDRIERGELQLVGSDHRCDGMRRSRWSGECNGYAVMEDPPTVLLLRQEGQKGVIVWLDTRNYGVDRDREPPEPSAWCQLICSWVRTLSQGMRSAVVGGWKNTAGSMAYASWRFSTLTHSVLCHTDGSASTLERQAYYGGRCECFRIGEVRGPLYQLDVKAMYPHLCLTSKMPARLKGCWSSPMRASSYLDMRRHLCIADVTIRTDYNDYPYRYMGHTVWPVGTFRTVLCGPELLDAMDCQSVIAYHRIAAYEGDPILADYMWRWNTIRSVAEARCDRMVESACKRIMCCLPGKLGQRDMRWVESPNCIADTPWGSWHEIDSEGVPHRYRSLDWRVQREVVDGQHPQSIPAVAAWVTSLGRSLLAQMIRCAGRSEVYYCDTDSLFCSELGYDRLVAAGYVSDNKWGHLRIKGVHQSLICLGVKHYILDGEVTCSGCPAGEQSAGPTADSVWFRSGAMTALHHGHKPLAERVLRRWERTGEYPLGRVGAEGYVSPLTMEVR